MTDTKTIAHALPEHIGVSLRDGGNPEDLEDVAAYLHKFAAPGKDDLPCLNCGEPQAGFFGAFTWSIAHGEGRCSGCGWPGRGCHYIKDRHGADMLNGRFVLQYHPDFVERRKEKAARCRSVS